MMTSFVFCKSSCGILLNCGHTCKGCCYVCSDANIHALCTEKCDRFLNCGHKCSGYCGSPCPPCKEKCSLVCSHRTLCINLCYRPCVHCEENCSRGCEHVGKCDKKCFETCSVDICKQTCREILPCGHRCIGFCGDPCPYLCRVCNRDDLTSNDPDNDFFVELDDCNHVIEIGEFEEHLENCIDCFIWPNCPVCNKPIRKSSRYKNILLKAKMSVLNSCDNSDEIDEVSIFLIHCFLKIR
ncbi:NFX1-type zinc finger-containing protein 1 [Caerostris extrusa]|uniref:NFX1-type zinc finger-containing protein 1 n=1 Tax=Caerostris extrusa TaxID=172846 RepID=A0AAV4P742_CAEEX|nr:NFX1-type zinc finger-containing protein 1 [Caerostris extrusa]